MQWATAAAGVAAAVSLLAGCAPPEAHGPEAHGPEARGTASTASGDGERGGMGRGDGGGNDSGRYELPQNWAELTVTAVGEGSIVTITMSELGWRSYRVDGADFEGAAWRAVRRAAPQVARMASVRQQFECHAVGAWLVDERDWDLESWRAENPNWRARILSAESIESVCNW